MNDKKQIQTASVRDRRRKDTHFDEWKEFCDTARGDIAHPMSEDYMFLAILQRSERARKGFVSAILQIPEENVLSCEMLKRSELGKYVNDKTVIFDVLVLVNKTRKVNIEMQVAHMTNWENRSLYYICREFIEGMKEGEDYNILLPLVHAAVLTERMPGGEKRFLSNYILMNQDTGKVYSNKLEIRLVNLKYLEAANEREKSLPIYRWARLLAAKRWEDIIMNAEKLPKMDSLEEAAMLLRKLQSNPEVRALALAQDLYDHDMATMKSEGRAEGRAEGRTEGRAEGRAEGRTEGRAEGRAEGHAEGCDEKSRAVAAKMLADDEPMEKIMRYCDLPEEEILLIREKGPEYNHK